VTNWYGKEERTVESVSDTAVWHSTGLPAVPLRWVLIRDPQGEFRTQALLCTDLRADPERIISWFVRRWQMEATFQEVRQRLGFETQRHWYRKSYPTFSDALALVRKELWAQEATFCGSLREADTLKVSREFVERLTDAVCYAA
jgi:hypothetical protein